jgi:very-short-patch-repair endonuclease
MTVTITVECDGYQCHEQREIDDNTDREVERFGWVVDASSGAHFCRKCSARVLKARREDNED